MNAMMSPKEFKPSRIFEKPTPSLEPKETYRCLLLTNLNDADRFCVI